MLLQMFVDTTLQLKKKTDELNLIAEEITPSIPLTEIYYFKELNCNKVDLTWNFGRVLQNLNTISVMIYQELTIDITGMPN